MRKRISVMLKLTAVDVLLRLGFCLKLMLDPADDGFAGVECNQHIV